MVEVVGVRYRDAGHIYYFSPGDSTYYYQEKVLVESQKTLHTVSYTHLRAHETDSYLVCRLLLEKKKK